MIIPYFSHFFYRAKRDDKNLLWLRILILDKLTNKTNIFVKVNNSIQSNDADP